MIAAPRLIELDPGDIKVFVHRDRDRAEFEQLKASIADPTIGQKQPAQVRDITGWPKEQRQKPGGGLFKWGLLTGEGRLLACQELGRKLICEVKEVNDAEAVGLFLSENLNRDSIPWIQRARLVKADIDAGMSVDEVAAKYFISRGHVQKFGRILNHTRRDLQDEIGELTMNDAEVFATLPQDQQAVVIQVANEEGLKGEIRSIIGKAREVTEAGGELSKVALKESLKRVDADLQEAVTELKPKRLHHSLGPGNLAELLQDPKFRKALDAAKINYSRFEALTNQ